MVDDAQLSDALQAASAPHLARRATVRTLRGVRGVPHAELARIGAAAWAHGVDLDEDAPALARLYGAAWEDGLLAIGLTAAALPDAPEVAWELGTAWLDRVDDVVTADALGWLVLGPALLALAAPLDPLLELRRHAHPCARRAGVAAGMAMLPARLEGPAAAPLRARVGDKRVQFVEEALTDGLTALADAFLRDESPEVRKALRRLLREWADADAEGVVVWADQVRGGLPSMLKAEVDRARRRAARA